MTAFAFAAFPGMDPMLDSPAESLLVRAGQLRQEVMRRGPENRDKSNMESIALVATAAGLRWGSNLTWSSTLLVRRCMLTLSNPR